MAQLVSSCGSSCNYRTLQPGFSVLYDLCMHAHIYAAFPLLFFGGMRACMRIRQVRMSKWRGGQHRIHIIRVASAFTGRHSQEREDDDCEHNTQGWHFDGGCFSSCSIRFLEKNTDEMSLPGLVNIYPSPKYSRRAQSKTYLWTARKPTELRSECSSYAPAVEVMCDLFFPSDH